MKVFMFLACLLLNCMAHAQITYLSSFTGIKGRERDSIIGLIKEMKCGDSITLPSRGALEMFSKINESTQLLHIFYHVNFNAQDFQFGHDVTKYLTFDDSRLFWLINCVNGKYPDTALGVAGQYLMNTSCYFLEKPNKLLQVNFYYNKLKPVIEKIDLMKSYVFFMTGKARELLVWTDNKVYVIDGDQLVPFNTYYKARYKIGDFRKLFPTW